MNAPVVSPRRTAPRPGPREAKVNTGRPGPIQPRTTTHEEHGRPPQKEGGALQLLKPSDPAWGSLFDRLPLEQQDIFYTPEYADLCARYLHRTAQVWCAVLETASSLILYPFIQRHLRSLVKAAHAAGDYQDLISLYGRGGAVRRGGSAEDFAQFYSALTAYCTEQRIVCGFDRYHPVMRNHLLAPPQAQVREVGGFVVADVQPPIEELEPRFKHAARKNIKKAERAGVDVVVETNLEHLEDFLSIYASTLQRNSARDFYYVDPDFYRELATTLAGRYRFFYARLGRRIVSCELVLRQGLYCHSFLGGTLADSLEACPNHLLKREIIRDAKASGCRYYLLGGGQRPYDGIWNYKRGFAPSGSVPSLVGGTIFDESAYASLRQELLGAGVEIHAERFQFYDPT